MPSRAVLFDLDGVIVDSRSQHLAAWTQLVRAHGIAAPPGYFQETFGLRNDAILGRLLPDASPAEVEALGDEKEATFRELASGRVALLPGVRVLLFALGERGIRSAVVTSTPAENLGLILDSLEIRGAFDALVSAEDVERGKPHPEGFLLAAARLGARPEECVVIEDAPAGIEAAVRAAMRSIGVTTTHHAAELAAAGCVVASLTDPEVLDFIER